ncbi:MAG: flagellar motor protein MotB, partial [Campylobacterota bacterium]|nr:flagellar motor protein MotB [Campylobacterota bacterium]
MAKKKCPDCPECMPEWLAAFGDLMSLLLCFFVLLLSMSTMDAKKVEEAMGSLAGAMSVLEGGTMSEVSHKRIQIATPVEETTETDDQVNKIQEAVSEMNEMQQKGHGPEVTLEDAEAGFVIKLPSSLLFKAGSATIDSEDALLFLKRISLLVDNMPNDIDLSVRGYTDDLPPGKDSPYKNNWELSGARAISVLQELILDGVNPARISAAAFSQYHPLATNATKE